MDLFDPITGERMNILESTNETYHCVTKLLGTMISVGAFRRDEILSCAIIAYKKGKLLSLWDGRMFFIFTENCERFSQAHLIAEQASIRLHL